MKIFKNEDIKDWKKRTYPNPRIITWTKHFSHNKTKVLWMEMEINPEQLRIHGTWNVFVNHIEPYSSCKSHIANYIPTKTQAIKFAKQYMKTH